MKQIKTIYLIRHGETDYNKARIVQGRTMKVGLNDLGKKQSEDFFVSYQHIPFKKVFTSNLQRTIESVDGFIKLGLPHERMSDFDESCFGIIEGNSYIIGDRTVLFDIITAWKRGFYNMRVNQGESAVEIIERLRRGWQYVISQKDEDIILICMHGQVIKMLFCTLLDLPLSEISRFPTSNLGLHILEYDYETGRIKFIETNNTGHIKNKNPQEVTGFEAA